VAIYFPEVAGGLRLGRARQQQSPSGQAMPITHDTPLPRFALGCATPPVKPLAAASSGQEKPRPARRMSCAQFIGEDLASGDAVYAQISRLPELGAI
jgi:hypothetical protein